MKKLRKWSIVLLQILGLFVFTYLGDVISNFLKLPIPGSIVGLVLLFLCLYFKIIPERFIKEGAGFVLVILPLFFIPATVGIIQYPDFLSGKGVLLIVLIMVSTFLTMIVAGYTSQRIEKKMREKEGQPNE